MQAVDGVSFTVNRGEVVAVVGESGSGKSVTGMTLMGLTRGPNARIAGSAKLDGQELLTASNERSAQDPRQRHRDDLPGSDQLAEPGLQGRMADRRADPHAQPADQQDRGDGQGRRADGARRRAARGRAAALLPARVLRRHAPARDDRDGALLLAEAADRRRADHGARRHDPGADPRRAAPAARRDQRRDHPRHPRPRGGCRHRRPRRRHVLGPRGRAGHARRALLRPAAPLHLGPARLDHADRPRPRQHGCRRSPDRRRRCWRPPTGCHFKPRCPHAFDQVRPGAGARVADSRGARARSTAAG